MYAEKSDDFGLFTKLNNNLQLLRNALKRRYEKDIFDKSADGVELS